MAAKLRSYMSIVNQTPSLMYNLCQIPNAGQTEKIASCQLWFHKAVAHCTNVLDETQDSTFGRFLRYFLPSLRNLHSFNEITEVNTDTLSESDCKLLLTKMAKDYVAREPHYNLAAYTLAALWAILFMTITIVALVVIGVVYTRFSGKIKKVFDEKESSHNLRVEEENSTKDVAKEVLPPNVEKVFKYEILNAAAGNATKQHNATNLQDALKYQIIEADEKALSILKAIPRHGTTPDSDDEMEPPPRGTLYERMNNLAQMSQFATPNFKVESVEPLVSLTDDAFDTLLL